MDNASELTELSILPALAFSPTSIVMFGDRKRLPRDIFELGKTYDKTWLYNYFYRTIYQNFLFFGKNRVLNLIDKRKDRVFNDKRHTQIRD